MASQRRPPRPKDNGDFKFSMLHFEGIRSEDTNVGVTGTEEVAGGLLGFSTTTAPPASALQDSQDELLNRFRGSDDKYWGWRTSVAPQFRPAPIVSNTTTITNLSPNADGTVPAATSTGARRPRRRASRPRLAPPQPAARHPLARAGARRGPGLADRPDAATATATRTSTPGTSTSRGRARAR